MLHDRARHCYTTFTKSHIHIKSVSNMQSVKLNDFCPYFSVQFLTSSHGWMDFDICIHSTTIRQAIVDPISFYTVGKDHLPTDSPLWLDSTFLLEILHSSIIHYDKEYSIPFVQIALSHMNRCTNPLNVENIIFFLIK